MTLDLLPYQDEGAAFLSSRRRAGLFDDMGVGKSAQAVRALDLVGARRILIVCPAAVREVWVGELKKFARTPRRILKARDIYDVKLWLKGRADVLILSYEGATAWADHLAGDLIDVIIFDEAHYLKAPDSKRTRALLGRHCSGKDEKNRLEGVAAWGVSVWFLTGTPNPNDAADIWSLMRFCGATTLNKRIFGDRYYKKRVGAYSTAHEPRNEFLNELKLAIKSFSLRRTKEQAGLQLPPIWLTTTTVDGDTREVVELLRQYPDLEQAILDAIEQGGLSFLDAQHVMTLRRLVAEAKAPAYAEMLVEEIEGGQDKIVVFGVHRRALDHIQGRLRRSGIGHVRFDGETSERDRKDAVEHFQRDGSVRVFLGNIRAAGTGLTLTTSARIDMFESDWSPAGNAQALMRVHRIGQTRSVQARFIALANSIDELVAERVARKAASIAKVGTMERQYA